ncbi:Putative ribonuclease H protein At1g65750 [Linum perenne]
MQTSVLPIGTCEEIDKRIRNFVWGSSVEERKVHLVSWEHICLPKSKGGLGLRLARHLNTAYMVKLAFLFYQNPDLFWVRMLHSKYFREVNGELQPRNTSSQSAVWKGISRSWNIMLMGARSGIRNGNDTDFWTSRWLDSGTQLIDQLQNPDDDFNILAKVSDMTLDNGNWNFLLLRRFLPESLVEEVAGMSPPRADLGEDVCTWGLDDNGRFSVRTAYELVHDSPNPRPEVDWSLVWRWNGPGRVQYFLWLAAQGKLLTNLERKRRHLTNGGNCPRCDLDEESILHVLRDCSYARQVWDHLGVSASDPSRTGRCPNEWIKYMIKHEKASEFIIACWYLWKARNELVFAGNTNDPRSTAARIQTWHSIVSSSTLHQELITVNKPQRTRSDIAWEPGAEGWVVLNTDGSVQSNCSKAAAGGLIRNADGRCLLAFCSNLGRCSIMRAELRGVIEGLQRAWGEGFRRIQARVDSQAILSLLRSGSSADHGFAVEVVALRELLERDWEVTITHTYREGNFAADYLASLGHQFPLGAHLVSIHDSNLNYFLRRDCIGVSEPRLIPVN